MPFWGHFFPLYRRGRRAETSFCTFEYFLSEIPLVFIYFASPLLI